MAFPYVYEFPLPEVANAPVPSGANYDAHNCAWLIEFFAAILAVDHARLRLRYENNTPSDPDDDIFVVHPLDGLYLDEKTQCRPKKADLEHYELFAKASQRLLTYMEESPAGIEYFQDTCDPTS